LTVLVFFKRTFHFFSEAILGRWQIKVSTRIHGLASFSNAKCSLHRCSYLIQRTFYGLDVTIVQCLQSKTSHQSFSFSRLSSVDYYKHIEANYMRKLIRPNINLLQLFLTILLGMFETALRSLYLKICMAMLYSHRSDQSQCAVGGAPFLDY
jgi:hypothetical protein